MKLKLLFISYIFIFNCSVIAEVRIIKPTKAYPTSVALFIDNVTFEKIEHSVIEYCNSIEADGLSAYVLISDWKTPDEIKAEILSLSKTKPKLEGVIFIGDIPIPMIRNAQHMTSAFKLDEDRYPWHRSSVPSDRFYDDFDLKFKYLKQDSVNKLYHYYTLLPTSPQRIHKDIYSARIKASPNNESKYCIIENYLLRISEQKKLRNKLDNMLVFTGHGYNSESFTSWNDESVSLREQFPQLYKSQGRLKKLFFGMNRQMKQFTLQQIQEPELDFAIFHAHGDVDLQLLLGYPLPRNTNENIESIKLYLRSKLRSAKEQNKSIEETKKYFMKEFNVPESWFEGAFEDSVIKADSILNYNLDIHIEDLRTIKPQAELIMFDECFNGSFHQDEYIAGEYVFGSGTTVAGIGNSVNVLQDLWADELIGLLGLGARVGQWHKFNNYLESHIIGDPTFHFTAKEELKVQKLMSTNADVNFWKKYLNDDSDPIRCLAINKISTQLKNKFEKDLVKIYDNDISPNVRMTVLKCLAELRSKAFEEILLKSINDPNEFIRRISIQWMGELAKDEYFEPIVKATLLDESDRIPFKGKSVLPLMGIKKALDASLKIVDEIIGLENKDELKKDFSRSLKRSEQWLNDELLPTIKSDTVKLRKRISDARTFRNYTFEDAVEELISLAKDNKIDEALRITIIEALGWYSFSPKRFEIIKACDDIILAGCNKGISDEAIRTKNRLIEGANNPITP